MTKVKIHNYSYTNNPYTSSNPLQFKIYEYMTLDNVPAMYLIFLNNVISLYPRDNHVFIPSTFPHYFSIYISHSNIHFVYNDTLIRSTITYENIVTKQLPFQGYYITYDIPHTIPNINLHFINPFIIFVSQIL